MKIYDPHLDHRKAQERHHRDASDPRDPMSSLISVELNSMDMCNRTCSFCPHADPATYPRQPDWKMAGEIAARIGLDLAAIKYKGRVSFSGYGEPLLYKQIGFNINIIREYNPEISIEMNTNGDPLTVSRIRSLFADGLSMIYVNMYDGKHQEVEFAALFDEAEIGSEHYVLRPHWEEENSWGLTLNNRAGFMAPLDEPLDTPCFYPFYKMFIDWNGDVLFCSNDWGREIIIGNVMTAHIRELWLSEQMREIRMRVAEGDRTHAPCNGCDIHGTMHGRYSRDVLMDFYARPDPATP